MDQAAFRRWLDGYVAAWRTYDEEAIGALFSDDAHYETGRCREFIEIYLRRRD